MGIWRVSEERDCGLSLLLANSKKNDAASWQIFIYPGIGKIEHLLYCRLALRISFLIFQNPAQL